MFKLWRLFSPKNVTDTVQIEDILNQIVRWQR